MQKSLLCIVIAFFFLYIFTRPVIEGNLTKNQCNCAFCRRCRKHCTKSRCYRKCGRACDERKRKAKARQNIKARQTM